MILSGKTLAERYGGSLLSPFHERRSLVWAQPFGKITLSGGLSFVGYDIHLSSWMSPIDFAGPDFALAHSREHFTMPYNLVGIVHDKSTLARAGLAVQNTVLEPGWRGYLTLELNSFRPLTLWPGMPIAQVIFHQVDHSIEGYKGKYQDQPNRPVEAL